MAVEQFVEFTLPLIEKEREVWSERFTNYYLSETEQQRQGMCILDLVIKSIKEELYRGTVVSLGSTTTPEMQANRTMIPLPYHKITPGVLVSLDSEDICVTGIVSYVNLCEIFVVIDDPNEVMSLDVMKVYKITKLENDVTYRRMKEALKNLLDYDEDEPSRRLIDTLFGLEEIIPRRAQPTINFVNKNLDDSQKEAVRFALSQKEVAIIHGPPGTGKTTTVVELIVQEVKQGSKVLATAPSNIAVDNLVEKLSTSNLTIVRVGHPARMLPHVQKHSLDAKITEIKTDPTSSLHKVSAKIKHASDSQLPLLLEKQKKIIDKLTKKILTDANIVLVTLISAARRGKLSCLDDDHFGVVVIDECSQSIEAACWIALLQARKCVLAGDHLQLPPTIFSQEAADSGLKITLMERLMNLFTEESGYDVVRMLTTQYRMHQDIMTWPSEQLYHGKLLAHPSVATHLLRDLEDVIENETISSPLLLIDTAGCGMFELQFEEEESRQNEGEADIVEYQVENLLRCGVKEKDIAVIAPYSLQVKLMWLKLITKYPDLEIKTVDGFQGREKEAVIISLVRSNTRGSVGFLKEKRRINVAVTRARRHVTVICDSNTVCHDGFIKSLVDYMKEKGKVQSAHEYMERVLMSERDFPILSPGT